MPKLLTSYITALETFWIPNAWVYVGVRFLNKCLRTV